MSYTEEIAFHSLKSCLEKDIETCEADLKVNPNHPTAETYLPKLKKALVLLGQIGNLTDYDKLTQMENEELARMDAEMAAV